MTTDTNLTQAIVTQAVIAKNHVPHSITGIPPALATTGRCDILAGYSVTGFNREPDISDSVVRQCNSLKNIMNARDAIILADAENAADSLLRHKPPDRANQFSPLGASVQICKNDKWIGTFRVVAVIRSNLVVERAGELLKWPQCKCRLIYETPMERMDLAVYRPKGKQRAAPRSFTSRGPDIVQAEMGTRELLASDSESSDIQMGSDSDEDIGMVNTEYWQLESSNNGNHKTGTFSQQGVIVCENGCNLNMIHTINAPTMWEDMSHGFVTARGFIYKLDPMQKSGNFPKLKIQIMEQPMQWTGLMKVY